MVTLPGPPLTFVPKWQAVQFVSPGAPVLRAKGPSAYPKAAWIPKDAK